MKIQYSILLLIVFALSFTACQVTPDLNLKELLENASEPPFALTSWEEDFISSGGMSNTSHIGLTWSAEVVTTISTWISTL